MKTIYNALHTKNIKMFIVKELLKILERDGRKVSQSEKIELWHNGTSII